MSTFDIAGLERLWTSQGGSSAKAHLMAAIAMAESSGNSGAQSGAGALGLWQVMPFWATDFGWRITSLLIPTYSATAAIRISGDGNHVGAWDTCYNPPSSAANRKDLTWPEQGSPAWNILGGGNVGGGGGGGGVVTVSHSGPSASDRAVMDRIAWANHLQHVAIPNNTAWVAKNRAIQRPRTHVQ